MLTKRKICVVTGTRAEYGLLYWLLKEIAGDSDLQLQIVVTGMHLSPEFGSTFSQIESDGFTIDAKVEMLLSSDSAVGIAKSIGLGVIGSADSLSQLKPDLVVVLGDRFEMLAVVQAAMVARIPIAHIHGGEATEGAFDDSIRHAITKMAHLHFVAAEPYRKKVVQLGEDPSRVYNFGAPGLDHLDHMNWLQRPALEESLGIPFKHPLFLVTYHPATLGNQSPLAAMNELLAALEIFPQATIIFTHPNADTGGRAIIELIDQWVSGNQLRARAFVSLGQQRYLSLLREADVLIGNSSSGLTEAPALRKVTVNIGDRQKGRLKATSVIDAAEKKSAIVAAIDKALSPEFRAGLNKTESLYGAGNVSRRIKNILKSAKLEIQKPFFAIEHKH
jgi:UDP-N-acetylglucosamine 2-epimerase (non-hydrolysing)/GDP/UDP-N,N'-diacetylbacillosamine 2-epimerase (hydrolysing)